MAPNKFFRKSFRLLVGLGIYSVIICVLLELGLRLLVPEYVPPGLDSPRIWQYHPRYGWVGQANIDAPFRQAAFSVRVQHNALGQRDSALVDDQPRKKRMLIIGDSFVWCYGVESHECFVDRLEAMHTDWDIINGGIAGTGTDQQLLYLQDKLVELKPDVVLVLVIQNDFQDITKTHHNNYSKPYFTLENGDLQPHQLPVPEPDWSQTLARQLTGRSFLAHFGQSLFFLLNNELRKQLGLTAIVYDPYAGFMFGQTYELMKALLREMIKVSTQSQARFVLVHGQMFVNLQLTVQSVADEYQLPYHNLDRAFFGYRHAQYQIPGDAHWNALGHELVAKDLDRFLTDENIFTPR